MIFFFLVGPSHSGNSSFPLIFFSYPFFFFPQGENEKQVLYCLMEITRCQGTFAPPTLVKLEREIQEAKVVPSEAESRQIKRAIVEQAKKMGYDIDLQSDQSGRYYIGEGEAPVHVRMVRDVSSLYYLF